MLRHVLCAAALVGSTAWAGEKLLKNDGFTGVGAVNTAVNFPEYHGAAVLLTPEPGDYPVTLVGIDVLAVTYNQGAPGLPVAFNLDLWDSSGGTLSPPRARDGGYYRPRIAQASYQFTTSNTRFNRITLDPPIVLDAGQLFISLGTVLPTADSDGTLALDNGARKPGANWWRDTVGNFIPVDLPDGGNYQGVTHNWIIRGVMQVPDTALAVTAITPAQGSPTRETSVVISGAGFAVGLQAFVGTAGMVLDAVLPPGSIQARVPQGLAPGSYDITVQNPGGARAVLPNGFRVLQEDGGASGGGAGGGAGGGGGGGGGGGALGGLLLDSITPNEAYTEDSQAVVVLGDGFQPGAQVLIGPALLTDVVVKSGAVINATLPAKTPAGAYDVKVINLDGKSVSLPGAFTVRAGSRLKGGCSCGASGALPGLALGLLALARRRHVRRR